MIRTSNLTKRFGATTAVDGISFEIGRGEVVGFLGPNGAGKTTTIRVLTCYHPASSGTAEVAGHRVDLDPVAVRRAIGYLPENVPIYTDLRVEEYLSYRAALKGVPRRERRAAVGRAMERCGVLDVARKLVGHVSRGYRQRVGLADALVANPPILVLDEPTSGLDPNQRRRIKDLVRELAAEHTILFSSHILAEVQDVSSRILIIHRGRLRADGTPDQLVGTASGRRLHVEARASAEGLREALSRVPGLVVESAVGTTEGYARAVAAVPPGADPRDAAAAALAPCMLRELRLELPSLEHFFQQVTEGREPVAPVEAAS
ncbi:MAG: putative transporter ATP-binding protein YxlF [Planctomycetota bacterium]|jgi:ABC-2 type transport system ATP-binding protein